MKQPTLFDPPPPTDPNVQAGDVTRLIGQNGRILRRLQRGPATNRELADIALKYTSRIHDLRSAGHVIEMTRRAGGVIVYTWKPPTP